MASHEFAHCDNCLYFKNMNEEGIGDCTNQKIEDSSVSKKSWCGSHMDRDPLDANSISVEYSLRRGHIMLELQHGKDRVKPVEEFLKSFGWDGVERVKAGKWTEER